MYGTDGVIVPPLIFDAQPDMYQKMSAASGTSAASATVLGLPLSRLSSSASSSACSMIRSPMRWMIRPRSEGDMRDHGPSSSARRAAWTARSMSCAPPSATVASSSPVPGSWVSNVCPLAAATHSPPISNSRVAVGSGGWSPTGTSQPWQGLLRSRRHMPPGASSIRADQHDLCNLRAAPLHQGCVAATLHERCEPASGELTVGAQRATVNGWPRPSAARGSPSTRSPIGPRMRGRFAACTTPSTPDDEVAGQRARRRRAVLGPVGRSRHRSRARAARRSSWTRTRSPTAGSTIRSTRCCPCCATCCRTRRRGPATCS